MAEGFFVTNKGIELINSAVPSENKVEINKAKFGSGGDSSAEWNYSITEMVAEEYSKNLDPETDKYKISDTDPKALFLSVVVPPEESCLINEVGFFDSNDNLIIYGLVREQQKVAGVKYQYDCWVKFDNVDTANVEIKIISSEFEKVEKLVEDTKKEFDGKIEKIETEFNIENYPSNDDIAALDNKFISKEEFESLQTEFEEFTGGESGGLKDYLLKTEASNTYLSKTQASSTYLPKATATETYVAKVEGKDLVLTEDITQITTNKTDIATIKSTMVSKVSGKDLVSTSDIKQITTNKDNIASLQTSVDTNKTDIANLKKNKVDKVDGSSLITSDQLKQITTNKNSITEIQGQIVEILEDSGSASLTIRVRGDSKYEGKTFTATNESDSQEYTATVENGVADIVIPDGGSYTVKNNLDALTVSVDVENPLITLAEFYDFTAVIRVSLPSALIGSTITCKQEGSTYKEKALSTNVKFNVHKTGTWTIGVEGNSYISQTVSVDSATSYSTEIKIDSGSSGIPMIVVKTDSKVDGKVIKCSLDDTTLEQTVTNKTCTFLVTSLDEWTLTCDDFPEKTVKVNVSEAKSYNARFSIGGVYTIRINKTTTDPTERVEYQDDAIGMTPASVEGSTVNYGDWLDTFFFEKYYPVMLKTDGTVDYLLDPYNYAKKVDGDYSDIGQTSYDGNAMVCIEKMYTRYWSDSTYEYMSITDSPKDGYVPFGFTNSEGAEVDNQYVAMFLGSNIESKLRSISGQSVMFPATVTSTSFDIRNLALKNGENYGLATFALYQVTDMVFNIIFKTEDCSKLGKGRQGAGEVNNGSAGTLPGLKTGLFAESGPIAVDTTSGCVKFMHIEDYFSDRTKPLAEMIDGTLVTSKNDDTATGTLYVKTQRPYATIGANGQGATSGYTNQTTFVTKTGNIKSSVLDNNYGRVPSEIGATSSTYECDPIEFSKYTTGTHIGVRRGGIRGLASSWFFNIYGLTYFRGSCCSRLSFEPPTVA